MLCSCATAFNHPVQDVSIAPEMKGALAQTSQPTPIRALITSQLGTYRAALLTRFAVTANTWTRVTVKVVEPCYKQTERALPRSITWWYWGDIVGGALGAGVGAIFPFVGDAADGTIWYYDRDVKIPVEPVENFEACLVESRKRPGEPFTATPDPAWQDPRVYPIARQGGSPTTYPTQH
jgi:hypothetical protein